MVNSLWFKWKSLRLPWRRSILAGQDLTGNTFWLFKDANTSRYRRMVKPDPKMHHSDLQVSPQWHQWLRYVREDPPSIEEQQQDLIRQAQIKQLARLADERWASKPSFLDKPKTQPPLPTTETSDASINTTSHPPADSSTPAPPSQSNPVSAEQTSKKEKDPWANANSGNPGDSWQPDSWTPTSHR
ncbi:NADH:ubiquinone oxidoreductase 17.2kDa subunit [Penicillium macrosclerotiorum]|uniref:NADH:ubiquinone oxidoreductase 17.2kDa subunit n=1 Tax=Penicillium macrosclerotiorum TaxID=303699 RepID=UPI0025485998|nr:NADH:ubiquinone oxidoreductase 17.2kDa subunit [Penicillium macrosclerotiorum]KAJ5679616.1 NADH:ubiquinone oxidoreductase 17.2kDa subunit [Penicillium macrosclerotiorum]